MSIALVSLGAVATGGSSASPSFGQATTAGNLLIAWVSGAPNSVGTPSGWTKAVTSSDSALIYYKANCAASETAPVFGSFVIAAAAQLAEFSGAATSSPLDKTAANNGALSPVIATALTADAAAGELVVSTSFSVLSKGQTTTSSHAYNNGATTVAASDDDSTAQSRHHRYAYGFTTGNTLGDSVTASDSNMNLTSLDAVIASFKIAAGATGKAPPFSSADRLVRRNSLLGR